MTYALFYGIAGIYFLLMSFRILHRRFMAGWDGSRILALRVAAGGLLVLSFYYAWHAWFLTTEEGRQILEMQEQMNRQYMQEHR
jgi:hypothetical protein